MGFVLWCPRCGVRLREGEYRPWCPRCKGPLEAEGLPRLGPVLGEGSTPLVEVGGGVRAKMEYLNPSGSFKDRGAGYSLRLASMLGYDCVVVDSSGNTGLSTAVYSARLGLRARVFVPRRASPGKKVLIRAAGAELVEAASREEAARLAEAEAERCFHVAHPTSPLFLEGVKSLGREMAGEARSGSTVLVPASSGTLLLGIYRGVKEAGRDFRLIAVQSPAAYSLKGLVPELGLTGGGEGKLLDALLLARPPRLGEMARAVVDSGGGVVVVGDEAVPGAVRTALRKGFLIEPSSAAVFAALEVLREKGILPGDTILVLTGSGLKYASLLEKLSAGAI
ncbi:pyridoxal-phosphate dependent enzyme [Aeropyrum camini]|uniref:Threonine synthase n=1 Tax=Aeropyrum camini SY1 = JCM 12091 TaxID=1198449 RepID=U3TEE3_9CREN|nr:pyridoxal-phosphate dependent enzyme [Aeropyrum camini]BAN90405.1 threonine synthase [Aeropyrum camini SY1 = JCM 12091]